MTKILSGSDPFVKNVARIFLFYVPVFYVSMILAVSLHEIVGHGVGSLLMGGGFSGFGVYPDGMGWADVDMAGLPPSRKAFVFAGGAAATTAAALVFLGLGALSRKRPYACMAFLVCAFVNLMDGLPYFFWDAVFLGGIGDFSMIKMLYPNGPLRAAVVVSCGLLTAAAVIAFNVLFYRISYRLVSDGGMLTVGKRIILCVPLFLLQLAGWFSFDWNALVPGVGPLPGIAGLSISAPILAFMAGTCTHVGSGSTSIRQAGSKAWIPMGAAWLLCAAVFMIVAFLTGNGVSF